VRGVARTAVVAGTAAAVSGRVQRRQEERWAGQEQEAAASAEAVETEAQASAQEPSAAAPAVEGYVAELEELARLRNQGIITEEEFQSKKRQVLGI
jgi:hypothetical protein